MTARFLATYGLGAYGLLAYGAASPPDGPPTPPNPPPVLGAGTIQAFDFSVDLLRAILWQYNDAANLIGILDAKADWYDANQAEFWADWYTDVFDLATADQFGLIVWSVILGFPVYVNAAPYPDRPTIGFGGSGGVNFDNGNFTDTDGSSYVLPISTQRRALQLRAYQLASSGTVPEINRALKSIFGDLGNAYLLDYGDMTQQYIFEFPVTSDLAYLFNNFDILPRPAGVGSTYIDATRTYFGFNPYNANFNNGNYGA